MRRIDKVITVILLFILMELFVLGGFFGKSAEEELKEFLSNYFYVLACIFVFVCSGAGFYARLEQQTKKIKDDSKRKKYRKGYYTYTFLAVITIWTLMHMGYIPK